MGQPVTVAQLKLDLEDRCVYNVLSQLSDKAQRWDGGGHLVHRVYGMGCLAQTGVENIKNGRTPINDSSTFKEMREIDEQMYEQTVQFMLPLAVSGIYYP